MKITGKKTAAAAAALTIALTGAQITAAAEQKVVTEYDDLWRQSVEVTAGETVKWYVNVPEGTEPKGCKATIKIPGLGWGTDTHNKEEGHLKLTQGENFVYEFTPEEEGDILYTCWMGSSCHKGYIHVTAAETEQLINDEQPVEIPDEQTETNDETLTSQPQETNEQAQETNEQAQENDPVIDEAAAEADTSAKQEADTSEPEEEVQADDEDEAKPQEKEQLSETKAASETASQASSQTTSNPKAGREDGSKFFAAAIIAAATALIASKKRRSR